MAKKQGKKSAKKIDPLRISLRLLANADREAARALAALAKGVLEPVGKPKFKTCKFQIGKEKYSRRLTVPQCQEILAVVSKHGDVLGKVQELLGDLNVKVAQAASEAAAALGVSPTGAKAKKASGDNDSPLGFVIVLGCCRYVGGSAPNLTKTQCQQYQPVSWDSSNPACDPRS